MSKLLTLVCVLLGASAIGTGLWGYQNYESANQLTTNNAQLQEELTISQNRILEMEQLQRELKAEVDSLIAAFTAANTENEKLDQLLTMAGRRNRKLVKQIEERKVQLEELKASAKKDRKNLMSQLMVLIKAKSKLEVEVKEVAKSNEKLTKTAVAMGLDPTKSLEENKVVAKKIKAERLAARKKAPEPEVVEVEEPVELVLPLRATSFRIEVGGRKDKVTAKAKKAKDIQVSFDLSNIPDGERKKALMYLVIVNDKGELVTCANPIKAVVPVAGKDKEITGLVKREVEIEPNQRINFEWELEDKVEAGYYRVEIHSEDGFLGEASFLLG